MATFAIGDMHGNVRLLRELLGKLLPMIAPQDTLVFLGDYIDRGPDSKGCIETIIRLKQEASFTVVTLLGNHEQWMLRSLYDPTRHSWLLAMEGLNTVRSYSKAAAGLLTKTLRKLGPRLYTERVPLPYDAFFDAMPADHLQFFKELKPYHRTDDVICAHGGVDAGGALDSANQDTYVWGPAGFPEDYAGSAAVVYGHRDDALRIKGCPPAVRIGVNRTYGIDTVSQGVLTAICFPGATVVQSGRGLS
jgi:serine/threonine protein phosphatase 1